MDEEDQLCEYQDGVRIRNPKTGLCEQCMEIHFKILYELADALGIPFESQSESKLPLCIVIAAKLKRLDRRRKAKEQTVEWIWPLLISEGDRAVDFAKILADNNVTERFLLDNLSREGPLSNQKPFYNKLKSFGLPPGIAGRIVKATFEREAAARERLRSRQRESNRVYQHAPQFAKNVSIMSSSSGYAEINGVPIRGNYTVRQQHGEMYRKANNNRDAPWELYDRETETWSPV